MEDLTGTTIAGYAVSARLGRGGQSTVYRAEDTQLHRPVALKVLAEEWLADRTSRKRFLLEAQTLSVLNHPNIAAVYQVDEYRGRPFLVMEFIDGTTLARHVEQTHPPLRDILALMIQIVEAVRYAHESGVLHRDLKPENILVSASGSVKLVDFGLAKLLEGPGTVGHRTLERLTATGAVMGTVAYLSPEQAQGQVIDERSDLFSLGILFYELLTGRAPFARDNPIGTLISMLHSEPAPFEADNHAPEALRRLVFSLLEKDPQRRPASAAEVLASLCRIAGIDTPAPAGAAVPRASRTSAWFRRHRTRIGVALGLLLLVGLAGVLWQSRLSARTDAASMLILPVRSADDERSRWLADVVTGELISALGGALRLKVLYFPGDSPQRSREMSERIRREQAVGYVVDGELIQVGEELKITARVLDGAESSVLWTGSVKGSIDDIYALTSKTASNVASVAGVYVAAEKIHFPGREVFDHYTRGLILVRRRESGRLDEAVRLLTRCTELDPDFAPAYAALAEAYLNYQNLGVSDDPRYLRECERFILEGLQRQGDDADLHMMRARLSEYRYDWGRSETELRRVIELKPSGFDAPYILQAAGCVRRGRIDEAFESYQKAREINPFNPVPCVNQVVLAAMTDNSDAAEDAYQVLKNLYAHREFLLIAEAWWRASRGEVNAASVLLGSGYQRAPHPLLPVSAAQMAFAEGDYRQAAEWMKTWLAKNRYSLESYWLLGLCHESLGDEASARANAREALQRARELAGPGRAEPLHSFIRYFAATADEPAPAGDSSGDAGRDIDTVSRYLRSVARARRGDLSALDAAGTPYDYSYWMNRFSVREMESLRKKP